MSEPGNGAKALAERLRQMLHSAGIVSERIDPGDLMGGLVTPEEFSDAILANGAVFLTAEEAERLWRIEAAARTLVHSPRGVFDFAALRAVLADPEPSHD